MTLKSISLPLASFFLPNGIATKQMDIRTSSRGRILSRGARLHCFERLGHGDAEERVLDDGDGDLLGGVLLDRRHQVRGGKPAEVAGGPDAESEGDAFGG